MHWKVGEFQKIWDAYRESNGIPIVGGEVLMDVRCSSLTGKVLQDAHKF